MKATIIRSICVALTVTLAAPHLFAQNTSNENQLVYQSSSNDVRKPDYASTENGVPVKSTGTVTVNEKILKNFNKKFPVNDVKWFKAGNGYIAIFKENETSNFVLFSKNGKMIYFITYGAKEQLPAEIKNQVRDSYEDYQITDAAKAVQDDRTIWFVNLLNNCHSSYIVAQIEDGQIEEIKNLKSAN